MKRIPLIILVYFVASVILAGCANQTDEPEQISQSVGIANPWSDWTSMEDAEAAAGFSFGLPEAIAGSFTASAYRTLNNELIEIIYRDADSEICVRKTAGEGQDISGDYNQYDATTEEAFDGGSVIRYCNSSNNAVKQLVSYKGYSWSLVASNGFGDNSDWDFVSEISQQ